MRPNAAEHVLTAGRMIRAHGREMIVRRGARMALATLIGVIVFGFLVGPTAALAQGTSENTGSPPGQGIVTLDADNTSINSILEILAARSGLNIVSSPAVHGQMISIHLKNTPFDEALNLVVRAAGLGYERVGNSILVTDVQGLNLQTGLVTRVFDLQYANAQDVKAMLDVLTQDVSANLGGDRIVIRGSQTVVDEAASIIRELDHKPRQVFLQARLIEVNTSKLLNIGVDWDKLTSWSSVLSEGYPGKTAQGALPDELDFLKLDQTKDFYRQSAAFEVALDALITDGQAKLLSNTKVVTVDGEPAEIFAGETIPVVVTSLQTPGGAGGVLQTVQIQKIDVGVKLEITPRIGEDQFITTLVQPEVSTIVRFVGPNSDLPETSTRRARSLVRVRDGQKIFLGGLLSTEKRRTVQKVPILGDIPLLGYLFRRYTDNNTKLDLVIEITPRIVGDEGSGLPVNPTEDEMEREGK